MIKLEINFNELFVVSWFIIIIIFSLLTSKWLHSALHSFTLKSLLPEKIGLILHVKQIPNKRQTSVESFMGKSHSKVTKIAIRIKSLDTYLLPTAVNLCLICIIITS